MKKGKKVNNGFEEQNRQSGSSQKKVLKRFVGNEIAREEPYFKMSLLEI
jgi:hypothetical protein